MKKQSTQEDRSAAFLKGKQIYLRKIKKSDAGPQYLSWINDADVTRGIYTGQYPTSMKDLKDYVNASTKSTSSAFFAICDNRNDLHIGNIKLESFDHASRTCGLGLIIGNKSYWGKGVGSEACELVIRYAFDRLNFRKITLIVFSNNTAAFNLYKKMGFVVEGVLKQHIFSDGKYVDKIFMSLFNPANK
jgi:RimJ/RimL family protein N-acetyltransferase